MRKAKHLTNGQYDELELPLTLGRDFSGVVVSKGHGMGNRLKLGDQVWGVVPVEQQGCHASYVVVDNTLVNNDTVSFPRYQRARVYSLGTHPKYVNYLNF